MLPLFFGVVLIYGLGFCVLVSAADDCPFVFVNNPDVQTYIFGVYGKSPFTHNGRPVYNDRFGNILYNIPISTSSSDPGHRHISNHGSGNYWVFTREKLDPSCGPLTSAIIVTPAANGSVSPGDMDGKYVEVMFSCDRTATPHPVSMTCMEADPTKECSLPSSVQCLDSMDVCIALDVSSSLDGIEMYQEFCLGYRLAFSFSGVGTHRVALVSFGSIAHVVSGWTSSGSAPFAPGNNASDFTLLDPPTSGGTGFDRWDAGTSTAIGEGLYKCLDLFALSNPSSSKGVVLLTDGYTNTGRPSSEPAALLRAANISILVAAVIDPRSKTRQEEEYAAIVGGDTKKYFDLPSFENYTDTSFMNGLLNDLCSDCSLSAWSDYYGVNHEVNCACGYPQSHTKTRKILKWGPNCPPDDQLNYTEPCFIGPCCTSAAPQDGPCSMPCGTSGVRQVTTPGICTAGCNNPNNTKCEDSTHYEVCNRIPCTPGMVPGATPSTAPFLITQPELGPAAIPLVPPIEVPGLPPSVWPPPPPPPTETLTVSVSHTPPRTGTPTVTPSVSPIPTMTYKEPPPPSFDKPWLIALGVTIGCCSFCIISVFIMWFRPRKDGLRRMPWLEIGVLFAPGDTRFSQPGVTEAWVDDDDYDMIVGVDDDDKNYAL